MTSHTQTSVQDVFTVLQPLACFQPRSHKHRTWLTMHTLVHVRTVYTEKIKSQSRTEQGCSVWGVVVVKCRTNQQKGEDIPGRVVCIGDSESKGVVCAQR